MLVQDAVQIEEQRPHGIRINPKERRVVYAEALWGNQKSYEGKPQLTGNMLGFHQWNCGRLYVERSMPQHFQEYGDWLSFFSDSRGRLGSSNEMGIRVKAYYSYFIKKYFSLEGPDAYARASLMIVPPSGNLKNFYVALATVRMCIEDLLDKRKIRVLVVGSMCGVGSGVWHEDFVKYMLLQGLEGEVDLYDSGQVPCDVTITHDVFSFRLQGFNSWYNGDGSEYDVVIDDIYSNDEPGRVKWKSCYWSTKDQTENVQPFFHVTEGRSFSHKCEWYKRPDSGCQCFRCGFSLWVAPYDLVWVQAVSYRIDPASCYKMSDAESLSKNWNHLQRTGKFIPSVKPTMLRAERVLSYEAEKAVPFWPEKVVRFFGVDPAVFGWAETSSKGHLPDIGVIVNKVDLQQVADIPIVVAPVGLSLPGYERENYKVPPGWSSWTRRRRERSKLVAVDLTKKHQCIPGTGIYHNLPEKKEILKRNIGWIAEKAIEVSLLDPKGYCAILRRTVGTHRCISKDYFCLGCQDYCHWCKHIVDMRYCTVCDTYVYRDCLDGHACL